MSISQAAGVKTQINPTANGGFYLAVLKTRMGTPAIEPLVICHNRNTDSISEAGIKAYHMMKDFPICALQWDALNPVRARVYARVCARRCLFKAFSFRGRHSLRLRQAFPRNMNLGGERERRVVFKPHIF